MATAVDQPVSRTWHNRIFAKRARDFVNRVRRAPGFVPLAAGSAVAAVMAVVTGAFGTGAMPLDVRIGFWATLMAWTWVKWQLWFVAAVRRPRDWPRAGAIGGVLLNAPLPLEIAAALRLWEYSPPSAPGLIWVQAMVIGGTLFVLMLLVGRMPHREGLMPALPPEEGSDFHYISPDSVLGRAGVRSRDEVLVLTAEDHYCRLTLANGRAPLVHARFGDLIAELRGAAGAQVNRGAWVADDAVQRAVRTNRRWRLELSDGRSVGVSNTHLPAVRARGWLARRAGIVEAS